MQFDFGPGIAQKLTWKFEEDLLRQRKRGNPRKLRNTLLALASCELYQNDYERGARLLEEGLVLSREAGDKRRIAISLNDLGLVAIFQVNSARARSLLEESLMLARELRDWQVMASPLNSLGFAVLDGGEHERAVNSSPKRSFSSKS